MTRTIKQLKDYKKPEPDYIQQIVDSIIDEFESFTSGYRVLMLTNRETNRTKKMIAYESEEFEECLYRLIEKAQMWGDNFRIYSSVNERDIEKAIRIFKQRQLDKDYEGDEARHYFYKDVKNRFVSSLMKPNARKETQFLIDVDYDEGDDMIVIKNELDQVTQQVGIIHNYETKNGRHLITTPFNPNEAPSAEINKDGQLLLFYNNE